MHNSSFFKKQSILTCKFLVKRLSRTTISVAAFALTVSAFAATNLSYTDHDPAAGMRPQFLQENWFPQIEEQSDGDIKIKSTFGGALFGSQEALAGISRGISNMGLIYPEFYPSQLPAFTIFPLFPSGPENFENILWFFHEVLDKVPEFQEELDKQGIHNLLITVGLPSAIASTQEISSLEDIKGRKIRVPGKWRQTLIRELGPEPVTVPWEDIFMSLQTKTIDGVLTNYDGLHAMKFDEAAKNVMTSKKFWWPMPFLHVINKKKYESLSQSERDALIKASSEAEVKFGEIYAEYYDNIKNTEIESGVNFIQMPDSDINRLSDGDEVVKLRKRWVKDSEAAGMKNAQEIMDQVTEIYIQALNREK